MKACIPELKDLADLVLPVRFRRDDQHAIKEVHGDAMRAGVCCAADASDTTVRGHDNDGGEVILHGPVEVREALNIKHVHLVNEENTRDDLCLPVLAPLRNLCVNLLPNLGFDLSGVTGEQCEESLSTAIDHINLVKRDRVDDLLTLL